MVVSIEEIASQVNARHQQMIAAGTIRRECLLKQLPQAIHLLRHNYGVTRIVLFGSLASNNPRPASDVDLAVENLHSNHYFNALDKLMEIFKTSVDLVAIEKASASLLQRINAEGQEL